MNFPLITNLKFVGIGGRGTAEERVILRAAEALNIGRYAVLQAERLVAVPGVACTNQFVFWFPNHDIEQGHYVLLYTRAGTNGVGTDKDGDTIHTYFWGKTVQMWNPPYTPLVVFVNAIVTDPLPK